MAWRRSGDKPLSEPMMVSLLTHICVTRPQWVIRHVDVPVLDPYRCGTSFETVPISILFNEALWAPFTDVVTSDSPHIGPVNEKSTFMSWPLHSTGSSAGFPQTSIQKFNDFSMIFQDKNPKFPWWFWMLQNGKTQDHMLRMVSSHILWLLLGVLRKSVKSSHLIWRRIY